MFRSFIRILFPQLSWKSMKRLRIICCMGIVKLYLQVRASLFTRDIVRKDKIKSRKTKVIKTWEKKKIKWYVILMWWVYDYILSIHMYLQQNQAYSFLGVFSENVKREKGCKTGQRRVTGYPSVCDYCFQVRDRISPIWDFL